MAKTTTLGKSAKKKQQSKLEEKAKSFGSLLLTLIVVLFVQSFFIQGYSTPTGSMLSSILIGDKMFFNQFLYGGSTPRFIPFTEIKLPYWRLPAIREPRRNDIVNFDFPGYRDELETSSKVQYLKRIIGQPGDVVEIKNKVVYVNGAEFPVPKNIQFTDRQVWPKGYTDKNTEKDMFPIGCGWNKDNYGPLRVPKKGDIVEVNKNNFYQWDTFIKREGHSIQLRGEGTVLIDGKETDKYTVQDNYYFMMGDNRDNSLDSRFWGFVPVENIVGKAWFVYFSWDSQIPFSSFGKLINSVDISRIGKPIE